MFMDVFFSFRQQRHFSLCAHHKWSSAAVVLGEKCLFCKRNFQCLLFRQFSFSSIWWHGTVEVRIWSCEEQQHESFQDISWILHHPWPRLHLHLKIRCWEAGLGLFRPDRVQPGCLPHPHLLHRHARLARLNIHLNSPNLLSWTELQKAKRGNQQAEKQRPHILIFWKTKTHHGAFITSVMTKLSKPMQKLSKTCFCK